jgi:hypothetical protein
MTDKATEHRDHRGHRANGEPQDRTDAPYAPDANGLPVTNGHAVEASDAPYDAHAFANHPSAAPGNDGTPRCRRRL